MLKNDDAHGIYDLTNVRMQLSCSKCWEREWEKEEEIGDCGEMDLGIKGLACEGCLVPYCSIRPRPQIGTMDEYFGHSKHNKHKGKKWDERKSQGEDDAS